MSSKANGKRKKEDIAGEVYDFIDEKTRYMQIDECCTVLYDIIHKTKILLEAKKIDYERMRERNPGL